MLTYQKPGYPKEAVIQAELYGACKKVGLDCDLQYCLYTKKGRDIPDLVVVEHDQILCVVEVKDYPSFKNFTLVSIEQIKRYGSHGVPVFVLCSIYDIPYLVKRLLEVKTKFLESIDPDKVKHFEARRQHKEKWDTKIATALDKFNEIFPGYKFTNNQSLEILASAVKNLGLPDLLEQMTLYATVEDFSVDLATYLVSRRKKSDDG